MKLVHKINEKLEQRGFYTSEDGTSMTIYQRILQWMCVLMIAWASVELCLAAGLVLLEPFHQFMITLSQKGAQAQFTPFVLSSNTIFIESFLDLFVGFLGRRGAKNPAKVGLFFWIALINGVVTAWGLASSISEAQVNATSLISSVFIIVLAVCTWQVRAQTGYFDNHPKPEDDE